MVAIELYSKCLKIQYKNTFFSKTYFFVLFCNVLTIIIPFILAYCSRGFLIKVRHLEEQPAIKFNGFYHFEAITNYLSNPIVCTNFPYETKYDTDLLDACSAIKVKEVDVNEDGINDIFEIKIHVLKTRRENFIKSTILILGLSYKLEGECKINFETILATENLILSETHGLKLYGILEVSQLEPLKCSESFTTKITNENIYDKRDILESYLQQNVTTQFKTLYSNFDYGLDDYFKYDLQMKIPTHFVYYEINYFQCFKWALVQYFTFFIIVAFVFDRIKKIVFSHKLFLFYEVKNTE